MYYIIITRIFSVLFFVVVIVAILLYCYIVNYIFCNII